MSKQSRWAGIVVGVVMGVAVFGGSRRVGGEPGAQRGADSSRFADVHPGANL